MANLWAKGEEEDFSRESRATFNPDAEANCGDYRAKEVRSGWGAGESRGNFSPRDPLNYFARYHQLERPRPFQPLDPARHTGRRFICPPVARKCLHGMGSETDSAGRECGGK